MIDPNTLTKRYYKIGEVAKMFGVATSLIRYWEGEFDQLNPQKNNKGVRRFQKEDVLVVDKIYDLVKVKGYKLDGAKQAIKDKSYKPQIQGENPKPDNTKLKQLRDELVAIRKELMDIQQNDTFK